MGSVVGLADIPPSGPRIGPGAGSDSAAIIRPPQRYLAALSGSVGVLEHSSLTQPLEKFKAALRQNQAGGRFALLDSKMLDSVILQSWALSKGMLTDTTA